MERLNLLGMRDAGLMTIRHPNLVARYNDALTRMTNGRRTALEEFRIDATGFSPEIAEEFRNPDYMNPLGVNLRYILVHIGQRDLAVLTPRFTSTRILMRAFIEKNREALFSLTSKDSVYGELADDTFKIRSLDDLLSIRRVVFTVATPTGIAEKARILTDMIAHFPTSESMWLDEAEVARMCDYARVTGDIRLNPSVPRHLSFQNGNFHTSLLGGVYVFEGVDRITIIHENPDFPVPQVWQNRPVEAIRLDDVDAVMRFLRERDLVVVPTVDYVLGRRDALLRKLEFLVIDHVSAKEPEADLHNIDFEETKRLIYREHDELPAEFHEIARALKFCAHGLEWSADGVSAKALAYMTAAKPGPDKDLVNHLLAHLAPADYLAAFSSNNPLFLKRFSTWNEARRGYVTEYLRRHLTGRGAAVFDAVFGANDPLGRDTGIEDDVTDIAC